jgi:hypothetical protein
MPSYRTGHQAPAEDRAEASDRSTLRVNDGTSLAALTSVGLPVARVECLADQLGVDGASLTITWHREPSAAQRMSATAVLPGRSLSHSW